MLRGNGVVYQNNTLAQVKMIRLCSTVVLGFSALALQFVFKEVRVSLWFIYECMLVKMKANTGLPEIGQHMWKWKVVLY